jgi:C-terminal peptidase prc
LWNIVNERYIYPDFNGMDWQVARDDIGKRIAAGLTDEQFHELMSDLIVGLNDDHSSFLAPDEVQAEDAEYGGTGTYTGIGIESDVNPEGRYLYVLTVYPNSPAEQAGIHPHDHILEIENQPSVDEEGNSQSRLLRGEEGTPVTVLVRTPGQQPRTVQLTRGQVSSVERIEHRLLPGQPRIGYLSVPSLFEESVAERTRNAMRELMKDGDLDGLILDLRTNGGGTYPNLRQVLGLFTSGVIGHLVDRKNEKITIRARAGAIGNSQAVPLAVLIGPSTESFAEVLAGALQAKDRATLIGQNTAGNIETLLSYDFEDGSRLWLAEESFRLPNGKGWESVGLVPDITIEKNWDEYTAEDDPVIARAITLLSG